jgi:hypothetical protein
MRAQELIQAILSMLDRAEEPQVQQEPMIAIQVDAETEPETEPETAADFYDDELRRMKQIAGLRDPGEMSPLSNAPNPQYATVSAVTTDAGGGPNQPKHPSDIRGEHPSMYPFLQHRG